MPGPWVNLREDPDQWEVWDPPAGEYYEVEVFDEDFGRQGSVVIRMVERFSKNRAGQWFTGYLVAESDSYLQWWVDQGPGYTSQRLYDFHVCSGRCGDCAAVKENRLWEFHIERVRLLQTGDLTAKRPAWLQGEVATRDMEFEIKNLSQPPGERPQRDAGVPRHQGVPEACPEWEKEDPELGAAPAGLRKELQELSSSLPEGEKAKRRRGQKSLDLDPPPAGELPAGKAKKRKKAKPNPDKGPDEAIRRKREKWCAVDEESGEDSGMATPSADEVHAAGPETRDAKARSKKKTRKKKQKLDRGPFGAGEQRDYGIAVESSSGSESDQSFRDAPTSSSKDRHMQLLEYSQKYPGRLASRLLLRMQSLVFKGEGAGMTSTVKDPVPPIASNYLITVFLPEHRGAVPMRTLRELKTLALVLDRLVSDRRREAADLIAQRIKALELSLVDSGWHRAQFLELLPQEGATLMETDETAMVSKQHLLDSKLKAAGKSWPATWQKPQEEALRKDADEKGKGKGKGQKGKKGKK